MFMSKLQIKLVVNVMFYNSIENESVKVATYWFLYETKIYDEN